MRLTQATILYLLLLFTGMFLVISCGTGERAAATGESAAATGERAVSTGEITISSIKDSINDKRFYNNWHVFDELKVNTTDVKLQKNLLTEIHKLSLNTFLKSEVPTERLQLKKAHLQKEAEAETNDYVPEHYEVVSTINDILILAYKYSYVGYQHEDYKYACYDLSLGKQINYQQMFNNPKTVVEKYNQQYETIYKGYMAELDTTDNDDFFEYDVYKSHLQNRDKYTLSDLNNSEFVYNKQNEITHIRFHYNGDTGNNRNLSSTWFYRV